MHEPYLEFGWGPLRHLTMAAVHRLMTAVLLRAADRVWISTPAWESRLRPFALGRAIEMRWLPVPGCETTANGATGTKPIVATLGRCSSATSAPTARLWRRCSRNGCAGVMAGATIPGLLLLGAGGEAFATGLLARHPEWRGRVHATGYLSPDLLDTHLTACDVLMQPYPDGITVRRTSAMAALARGRAVVTTTGHLAEPAGPTRTQWRWWTLPMPCASPEKSIGYSATCRRAGAWKTGTRHIRRTLFRGPADPHTACRISGSSPVVI